MTVQRQLCATPLCLASLLRVPQRCAVHTREAPPAHTRAHACVVASVMDELRVETTKCDNAIIATMIVLQWVYVGWGERGAGGGGDS